MSLLRLDRPPSSEREVRLPREVDEDDEDSVLRDVDDRVRCDELLEDESYPEELRIEYEREDQSDVDDERR